MGGRWEAPKQAEFDQIKRVKDMADKEIDFAIKLKEMIDGSQQEIDEGIYEGDYDIFCFMKECDKHIAALLAANKKLKEENDNLRAELTEWQCGVITLEEYEAEIRPT